MGKNKTVVTCPVCGKNNWKVDDGYIIQGGFRVTYMTCRVCGTEIVL